MNGCEQPQVAGSDGARVRLAARVGRRLLVVTAIVGAALALAACGGTTPRADRGSKSADALAAKDLPASAGFALSSASFTNGSELPARFSCDSTSISPALAMAGVPSGTTELAIVVDDPDATDGTYVHWIVAGLSPETTRLVEDNVPAGATQARNSAGGTSYGAVCPPKGEPAHNYRFAVYALDAKIGADIKNKDASDALGTIAEHATARATMRATYVRAS